MSTASLNANKLICKAIQLQTANDDKTNRRCTTSIHQHKKIKPIIHTTVTHKVSNKIIKIQQLMIPDYKPS